MSKSFLTGLKNRLNSTCQASSSMSRPPNDAPPAYTPAPNPKLTHIAPTAASASGPSAAGTHDNDPYAFLETFDTIFLIDDSGSMAGSSWRETRDALAAITPVCTTHDADGIDIYFLNHRDAPAHHNVTSASTVHEIFTQVTPRGTTPTGQRLHSLLKPHLDQYKRAPDSVKPINIICITDGVPTDDVESPLISAARKLDKLDAPSHQVGVQFFQVGRDPAAARHLQTLDDELRTISGNPELRDIVDTVPFRGQDGAPLSGDGILKVVLGAVNRRLDRQNNVGLHSW